jgi:hypothetical protein
MEVVPFTTAPGVAVSVVGAVGGTLSGVVRTGGVVLDLLFVKSNADTV